MRRTVGEALDALRRQAKAWADGGVADIRVMVYPPEFEAAVLDRLPPFAAELAKEGTPIDVVDIGQRFASSLEATPKRLEAVVKLEQTKPGQAAEDFGVLARRVVFQALEADLPDGAVCRVLCNVGALASVVSYSAITNEYFGSTERHAPATVIAFPGEGDDRSLNLLNLRVDTNYRAGRI
jgi:hypothetical protein